MKHELTQSKSVKIARNVRSLILWTERGAARHAKMLETDQAWEVFEKLEGCYFGKLIDEPAQAGLPVTVTGGNVLLTFADNGKIIGVRLAQDDERLVSVKTVIALLQSEGWIVMPKSELKAKLSGIL